MHWLVMYEIKGRKKKGAIENSKKKKVQKFHFSKNLPNSTSYFFGTWKNDDSFTNISSHSKSNLIIIYNLNRRTLVLIC